MGAGPPAGWPASRIARHEWRPLLVLGLIFTAQIGLMNVGTGLTSAAHGSVVLNLYAVHTVVLAHFLIPGDRLTARRLAGALVAYGGIVLLFAGDRASAGASLVGDALRVRRRAPAGRAHRSTSPAPCSGWIP